MLTFKKGGYTYDELLVLYYALKHARSSMRCAETGCDECKNRKPCADLARCSEYVYLLLDTAEKENK